MKECQILYLGLTNLLFLLRFALAGLGKVRVQIYYPVLCCLFLFSAFRYNVGCDWLSYYYQYDIAPDRDWSSLSSIRDPIWWAILSWINTAGLPYPVVNIVSSAIFFVGIHVLARRQPDPLGFLVLMFPILIINMPMSGIRQGAAIGLICIAFAAFCDRRPIRFALWVALAAGFHISAIVFMALLPVSMGRFSLRRLILSAIILLPGVVVLGAGEALQLAINRYHGTDVTAAGAVFRVGILGLSSLYFFIFMRKRWLPIWPRDYGLAVFGAIGMAFALILIPISSVIGDRIGYYFTPLQAMIFARLPYLSGLKNAPLHFAIPYLGLLLTFAVWSQISANFQHCYNPYQTWIFGFPGGDPVGR